MNARGAGTAISPTRILRECGMQLEGTCPRAWPAIGAMPSSAAFADIQSWVCRQSCRRRPSPPRDRWEPPPIGNLDFSGVKEARKQVTVLFADTKGSMELIAFRDPEDARRILDPVLDSMMTAVNSFGGTVTRSSGDGIMALFGAPTALEDHALRACQAALRIQDLVQRLVSENRWGPNVDVNVRVGLNSGEVVVHHIQNPLRVRYSPPDIRASRRPHEQLARRERS